MHPLIILAGFLTSLTISIIAIPSIVRVAFGKGLYGVNRKNIADRKKIPTLGGLAIFAGVIISLNLFGNRGDMPELPYLTAGAVGLFFIGLKDDILVTAPWWKFLGQVLVALVICIPAGLRIEVNKIIPGADIGGPVMDILLTVLVMTIIINSYNLIDGVDGLASGIGILSSLLLGIIFHTHGLQSWTLMSAGIFGSLAGFSWYNVFSRRRKIYMGDTGSLFIGFLLSLMVVRFLDIENPAIGPLEISASPAFILALFIIPVFDTLRIIIVRIRQGRSPFRPDRQHIHYKLEDLGLKHLKVTGVLLGINLFILILFWVLQPLGNIWLACIILAVSLFLSLVPGTIKKKN
jgi:UDP-N-acetylmuramyl pentapeptide phosphotransferase/UDP-N-acetylglucosamine-1-phosphate transferase